jgi:hypothetical protein
LAKKKLRARDVAIPIGVFILLIFVIVGTIEIGIGQGWQIPGIGSVGLSGQNGQTGSGTSFGYYTYTGYFTSTTTGSNGVVGTITGLTTMVVATTTGQNGQSGQSIIPVGKVGFNMQLIADFSDGTNSTISSSGTLPGLDMIQIGGRSVRQVRARTLVGFVSASPLPSTAVADIVANVTMYNERTHLTNWRSYEFNTGFVDGGTTALVLLPDFAVAGEDVYSDLCNQLTNGTTVCSHVGGAPASRRIDWTAYAVITISGLSVIPETYSGYIGSSADFSASISGCTNCGGNAPTIPAASTSSTSISTANRDKVTVTKSDICTSNCGTTSPGVEVVKAMREHAEGAVKDTADATGKQTAEGRGLGSGTTCLSLMPLCIAKVASLLPVDSAQLSLGNGAWQFINPWAAGFFTVIYVAATLGFVLMAIVYRRLGRKR